MYRCSAHFPSISSPSPSRVEPEEFLVVHTPMDRHTAMMGGGHNNPPSAPGVTPAPAMGQSGRGGGVVRVLFLYHI